MGNHEYCTTCGESDFHLGQPCNPLKVEWHKLLMNGTLSKLKLPAYLPEEIKSLVGIDEYIRKRKAELRRERVKTT